MTTLGSRLKKATAKAVCDKEKKKREQGEKERQKNEALIEKFVSELLETIEEKLLSNAIHGKNQVSFYLFQEYSEESQQKMLQLARASKNLDPIRDFCKNNGLDIKIEDGKHYTDGSPGYSSVKYPVYLTLGW